MDKHCVVFIDNHGTPSVIGPFDTIDLATKFAQHMRLNHDYGSDTKTTIKIAGLTSNTHFCTID